MRFYLLSIFLFFNGGLFSQSQVQVDVQSPKPSISIDGMPCNIMNTIWSCIPKTCDSLVITEGDSIEFCTYNQISLNTDSNYYMQWEFNGSANFPTPFYDSFPNLTPICYYPKWNTAGNYTVDIYYNGWLSAYPYSDCWAFGPSHWIIGVHVMQNMGIIVPDNNSELTYTIFPNPGDGMFHLQISHPEKVKGIFVTTLMGRKIPVVTNETQLDLAGYPAGIYFLNLETENGILVKKIVKG